jgi:hypothetical protein
MTDPHASPPYYGWSNPVILLRDFSECQVIRRGCPTGMTRQKVADRTFVSEPPNQNSVRPIHVGSGPDSCAPFVLR